MSRLIITVPVYFCPSFICFSSEGKSDSSCLKECFLLKTGGSCLKSERNISSSVATPGMCAVGEEGGESGEPWLLLDVVVPELLVFAFECDDSEKMSVSAFCFLVGPNFFVWRRFWPFIRTFLLTFTAYFRIPFCSSCCANKFFVPGECECSESD